MFVGRSSNMVDAAVLFSDANTDAVAATQDTRVKQESFFSPLSLSFTFL